MVFKIRKKVILKQGKQGKVIIKKFPAVYLKISFYNPV